MGCPHGFRPDCILGPGNGQTHPVPPGSTHEKGCYVNDSVIIIPSPSDT